MTAPGYRTVVVTSGHMIDQPDRPTPRFPASLEPVVAARIDAMFASWRIGARDLVINGGACGADILFAECARRRGAAVELVLASPPDQFVTTSVARPTGHWVERFEALLAAHPHRVIDAAAPGDERNEFERANAAIIERARRLAPPATLRIGLVWDEKQAPGHGGTGDFAELARDLDCSLAVVNPTLLTP